MLDPIFQPFIQQSPITVMAGAALARLLSPQRLDRLFDQARQGQYAHRLLFSSVFSLMAAVVAGSRKSVHHAYQTAPEPLGVSVVAVYDKLKGIEPCTCRALVRDTAAEVAALIEQMGAPGGAPEGAPPPLVEGYHTRILDGNCLAATEHRLQELRATAAGALPGKGLVVLDADRGLIADVFPCQDGHAQERALLGEVIPTLAKDQLWIDDRNFCTFGFLHAIHQAGAFFITRRHANLPCEPLGKRRKLGRVASGVVYEQVVMVSGPDDQALVLRQVQIELDRPTRNGDSVVSLLSNLPAKGPKAVGGRRIAELYAKRWTIETAFQELALHLNSEINTLGYPKAALFGFCVALVLYNAIALLRAGLRGAHGAEKVEREVSNYYIAAELETTSRGMMIAIGPQHWEALGALPPQRFAQTMLMLAGHVQLRQFQKHPRGPKKPPPKRRYDPAHPHVSTARLLAERKRKKGRSMKP